MRLTGSLPPPEPPAGGVSTFVIAATAFVAVGVIAWIGLEATRPADDHKPVISSAPPAGTARQVMMALKVPYDRENEQARLALLNDEDGPMIVKPLETVVELTQIDREPAQPVLQAAPEPIETAKTTPPSAAEPDIPPIQIVEVKPPNCVDRLRAFASDKAIQFAIGSAELKDSALPDLKTLGRMAENCPNAVIHVTGHSDSTGSDFINLALSWKRADNAVASLAALGVDTSAFEPVGYGARIPLAQGDASDDDLNRRVEFEVLAKSGDTQ